MVLVYNTDVAFSVLCLLDLLAFLEFILSLVLKLIIAMKQAGAWCKAPQKHTRVLNALFQLSLCPSPYRPLYYRRELPLRIPLLQPCGICHTRHAHHARGQRLT